jgi:hypothetical protein
MSTCITGGIPAGGPGRGLGLKSFRIPPVIRGRGIYRKNVALTRGTFSPLSLTISGDTDRNGSLDLTFITTY